MTKLVDVLGKESLTYYEAGQLLIASGTAIKGLPGAVTRNVEQGLDDAKRLVDSAKRAIALSESLLTELEKGEELLCRRYDELYTMFIKKREELRKKLETLEPLPTYHLPYNLDELFKTADMLSNLSDEQFAKMIELAKALAPKK